MSTRFTVPILFGMVAQLFCTQGCSSSEKHIRSRPVTTKQIYAMLPALFHEANRYFQSFLSKYQGLIVCFQHVVVTADQMSLKGLLKYLCRAANPQAGRSARANLCTPTKWSWACWHQQTKVSFTEESCFLLHHVDSWVHTVCNVE